VRSTPLAILLSCLLVCLPVCGCGGGGGPAPAPGDPAVTLLGTLKAVLKGSNETVVVDADARATVLLDLLSDGTLSFGGAAETSWAAAISGAHIHRGAAGTDGPIEVDLLSSGAVFAPATASASGGMTISPALAAEIAATPDAFYVNIHTSGGSSQR
jgi:hypothetical protein